MAHPIKLLLLTHAKNPRVKIKMIIYILNASTYPVIENSYTDNRCELKLYKQIDHIHLELTTASLIASAI